MPNANGGNPAAAHGVRTAETPLSGKEVSMNIGRKEKSGELYKAILQLKNEQECYDFFQDLCTVPELRSMEQRFEVAYLLYRGWIYNDILARTGASSATISRVSRSLNYGTGAYERLFTRELSEKKP
jgi:TrpR-related protein YerC/YecD